MPIPHIPPSLTEYCCACDVASVSPVASARASLVPSLTPLCELTVLVSPSDCEWVSVTDQLLVKPLVCATLSLTASLRVTARLRVVAWLTVSADDTVVDEDLVVEEKEEVWVMV